MVIIYLSESSQDIQNSKDLACISIIEVKHTIEQISDKLLTNQSLLKTLSHQVNTPRWIW